MTYLSEDIESESFQAFRLFLQCSQRSDKQTRQNSNFSTWTAYLWSAHEPTVHLEVTCKTKMKWYRTAASSLAVLTSYSHFHSLNEEETLTSSSHFFIWYSHRQLKNFYSFLLGQLFLLTSSPEVTFPFILFLWLQHFRVKHFKSPAENTRRANPGPLRTTLEPCLNSQFLLL